MSTNCSQSAEADDICKSLERAVLKFFVGPIEDVDTFLFAEGDDSAVGISNGVLAKTTDHNCFNCYCSAQSLLGRLLALPAPADRPTRRD